VLLKHKKLKAQFSQKLSLNLVKLTVALRVIISRVIVCQLQLRVAVNIKHATFTETL
jgi:hypothetical protein